MDWDSQGCTLCRKAWARASPGDEMTLLGTNPTMHCRVYQCRTCRSYWEELERYAHQVSQPEANRVLNDSSFKMERP